MTAKLKLELDNRTGPGFAQIIKDLGKLENQTRETDRVIQDLNEDLTSDASAQMAESISQFTAECAAATDSSLQLLMIENELAAGFDTGSEAADYLIESLENLIATTDDADESCSTLTDRFSDLQDATGDSGEAAEESGEGWATLIDSLGTMRDGCFGLQAGLQLVADYAVKMADKGNDSFKKFIAAGDDLLSMLNRIAESEGAAHMIEKVAEVIETAIPYVEAFGKDLIEQFTNAEKAVAYFTSTILKAGEAVGIFDEGTSATFDQLRKETEAIEKQKFARRQQEREAEKVALQNARELAKLDERRSEVLQEQLENEQRSAATELVTEQHLEQQIVDARKLLEVDEQRRHTDASRISAKQAEWAQEKAATAQIAEQKKQMGDHPAGLEENGDDNAAAQRKRQASLMINNLRSQIGANQSLVAKQVIDNRAQAGLQQWWGGLSKKQRTRMYNNGKWTSAGHAGARRAMGKARQQAVNDINSGRIGNGEGEQAVNDLTGKIVSETKASGQFSAQTIQSLQQASSLLGKQQDDIGALNAEMQRVNSYLQQLVGRGMNSTARAQRQ